MKKKTSNNKWAASWQSLWASELCMLRHDHYDVQSRQSRCSHLIVAFKNSYRHALTCRIESGHVQTWSGRGSNVFLKTLVTRAVDNSLILFFHKKLALNWCKPDKSLYIIINRLKPIYALLLIKTTLANHVDPDQTLQNAASDHGLHC